MITLYADYNYYYTNYLVSSNGMPSIFFDEFDHWGNKASSYINLYTHGNIGEEIPDEVKKCCCELAELLYKYEHTPAISGVTSEKVGDISKTYDNSETAVKSLSTQIKNIIYTWLANTGLLYQGGSLC
ncbi:MAG TPA: hypothetical protein DCG28_01265 [Lachnospiraceae bacterium]|nr:hypothetical protein [Lachnospiraceae bacterium]